MKRFDMDVDDCKGQALAGGALVILKAAVVQRLLDHAPHTKLVTPQQYAESISSNQIEKFQHFDLRLRHGLELIIDKLSALESSP
jgi:hypothetical protein